MNAKRKTEIIDELMIRVDSAIEKDITRCIDDIKVFVMNAVDNKEFWFKRIEDIRFGPMLWTMDTPDRVFRKCWEEGRKELQGVLSSLRGEIEIYQSPEANITELDARKIFIIHGHDDTMKLAVQNVLNQLELEPIILHELPNKGRTIIEKFESHSVDIGFAIVLLSPDDQCLLAGKSFFRSRQNVIFEWGYFVGKLGREKVLALYKINSGKKIELPSDLSGVLYEPFDETDGKWKIKILQELQACGYMVDANRLIKK